VRHLARPADDGLDEQDEQDQDELRRALAELGLELET
jgi:hypothetical protein